MKAYQIMTRTNGIDLGRYQGETGADALDAMARDAGYEDYASAVGSDEVSAECVATEVESLRGRAYLTNNVAIEPSTECELFDNGMTGDRRVTLCCATGLGQHARETLYYLQTNGDPVLLTDDPQATQGWIDTLGCDALDVIEAIRGSNRGASGQWAIEQINAALVAELDEGGRC